MDHNAIATLTSLTQCDPATAERVIAALVDRGWSRPDPVNLNDTDSPPMTANGALQAHTDGSCLRNPGPGGWAVVFTQNGKVVGERSGAVPHATNNQMELAAIREAVRHAPAGVALEVVTDSALVIGWLSKGFKRNEPQCAALCGEIEALARERTVALTFVKVKGHAGNAYNERADHLAAAASRGVRSAGA